MQGDGSAPGSLRLGCPDPRDGWLRRGHITIRLPGCSLETEGPEPPFCPRGLKLSESSEYQTDGKAALHRLLAKVEPLSLMGKQS